MSNRRAIKDAIGHLTGVDLVRWRRLGRRRQRQLRRAVRMMVPVDPRPEWAHGTLWRADVLACHSWLVVGISHASD